MGPLTALGLEIGITLAKKVGARLINRPKADENLRKADSLIATGTSAVSALRKAFGPEFDEAMTSAIGTGPASWTFEAGRADYVRVALPEGPPATVYRVLRDELNINLDRVARGPVRKGTEQHSYFLGALREWMERYRELAGRQPDAEETFRVIESLLDGKRRNFADVFRLLQRTGLGTVGALLVIQAVLIATSTGVGIVAVVSTWLLGIPVVQVGALVVGGGLLFALSRVEFAATNTMSASVAAAYKLLDRAAEQGENSTQRIDGSPRGTIRGKRS